MKTTQEQSGNQSRNYNLKKLETEFIRTSVYDEFMDLKNQYQFQLFHLTVTWQAIYNLKPHEWGLKNHISTKEGILNDQFQRFYIRNLVPYLIDKRRLGTNNRPIQPIAVCFIEDPKKKNYQKNQKSIRHFGNREDLHHHCLIAAKGMATERLLLLCGTDTLEPHFQEHDRSNSDEYKCIYSSDLKEIVNTKIQVPYPNKKLWKFREETMLKFNYPINYDRLGQCN